jgi:hypothetical protein
MDKKIAGLLGAVATLGAFNTAQAATPPSPAPSDVLRANSFADLLEPIPDAAKLLQAIDESAPARPENVTLAQLIVVGRDHHHHHHHHHAYRPRIVVVPPRFRHHHHHHHHHHHSYYRD